MKIVNTLTTLFLLFILVLSLGFLGSYLAVGSQIPDVDSLKDVRLQTPMRIYSDDDLLITEFGGMRRIPVTLSQVPQDFINALIATEDQRFFEHSGVDFMGVGRAALNLIATGRKSQGASTITMLVARNYFLSRVQTFKRKITEIFLAWQIERELSKEQILERLLNKIEFGHRALGLGAAAQIYYGKSLQELGLPQLAVLAGIPKGQSRYNPISYPKNALSRRNHVLKRMLAENYISTEQYEKALSAPIKSELHSTSKHVAAPYFAEMVRAKIIEMFGIDNAYNAGLNIYTTLDVAMQKSARLALRSGLVSYDARHGYRGPESRIKDMDQLGQEAALEELELMPELGNLLPALVQSVEDQKIAFVLANGEQHEILFDQFKWARQYLDENKMGPAIKSGTEIVQPGDIIRVYRNAEHLWVDKDKKKANLWYLAQIPIVNGALVGLDTHDGAIKALVGGFDFDLSKYNRVVQAERQPGSNFKPFIYSAALEQGFTAASIVNDAPITEADLGSGGFWRPKNTSDKYKGPMTLRDALRGSVNSISVRLVSKIGINFTREYLQKFGFKKESLPLSKTLSLGSAGQTPLDMVRAYGVIANGGFKVDHYFIKKVTDSKGNILYQSLPASVCEACELEEETSVSNTANTESQQPAEHFTLNLDTVLEPVPKNGADRKRVAPRVIEARNNFILTNMMQDVIKRGTGYRASKLGRSDLAGKTGTTNDNRDAWFSGFSKSLAVSAWVGFDDNTKSLGRREFGSTAALPIWVDFMRDALKQYPEVPVPQPPGLVTAKIDPATGELAGIDTQKTRFELFRIEFAPQASPNNVEPEIDDEEEPAELF